MTIEAIPRFIERAGNSSTLAFDLPFIFFETSDLVVKLRAADGSETLQTLGTHYNVSGGNGAVGTVTFTAAPPTGITVVINAETPISQQSDFPPNGKFPSETAERALDRNIAIAQELKDTIADIATRAVQVDKGSSAPELVGLTGNDGALLTYQDGEVRPLAASPFAGKFFAGDANGKPVPASGFGADAALRDDLAASTGARLVAYRVSSVQDKLDEIISITDFPGTPVAQFKAAAAVLTARGGGTLNVPRGSYNLASAELSTPITLTDNITVKGNGSLLTITGTSFFASIFRAVNASNVLISDLLALSNNKAVADATSGAFFNFVHDSSGAGVENIRVEHVRLQNFAAERWISIVNSAAHPIRGVRINDVSAISQTGNSLNPNSIVVGASAIFLFGNTQPILDVEINNLYCEAQDIKCGITIFHKVQGVIINKPTISSAGQNGAADDKGAYAINIYGDVGELSNVTINSPIITSPRSCGIYLRGVDGVAITNPRISGQTDLVSSTLPKGAIATNGASNVTVSGGKLSSNAFDVSLVATTSSTAFNVSLRGMTTTGATQYSVLLNPASGSGSPFGFEMANCLLDSAANGVVVFNNQAGAGRNFANVSISDTTIIARGGQGVALNPNGSAVLKNYKLANVRIAATSQAINADSATGDLSLKGVEISDAGSSVLTYGVLARNFPELHIEGLMIRDMGTGYATLTDSANGTINGLKLRNVVNGCSPNSLGMIAPTVGGEQGWRVQNLNPVEAGTALSKYVNQEWLYSGTWLEQRVPTGN